MSDGLLPCPFCGGEGLEVVTGKAGQNRYKIVCSGCGVKTFETVASPLHREAWNRRDACFHCQFGAKPMTGENMRELGWVRERTCYPERPMFNGFPIVNGEPHCSRCGMEWGWFPIKPAYCPTCGSRVVEHD